MLGACGNLRGIDYRACVAPDDLEYAFELEPEILEEEDDVYVAPVWRSLTLEGDTLFGFGLSGLLPEGRAALNKLVDQMKEARIDRIELVGHTDRLGSHAYNMTLSQQRADAVKQYLQSQGVDAPINAIGKGASEPITEGCVGNTPSRALISCLQPDRRVSISIIGTSM